MPIPQLSEHHRVVIFSGAGMSAESGVPTYRGAGGIWKEEINPEDTEASELYAIHLRGSATEMLGRMTGSS